MKISNNVITFPKENKNPKKIPTIDDINRSIDQMNLYHIQETIASIIPLLFNQIEVAGFSIADMDDEEESIKYGAFIIEAIRAILCRHYDLYHPFQDIIDNVFEDGDGDEIKVVKELIVKFKDDDEEKETEE